MSAPRQKAKLRVVHCHGCRKGVLVQFEDKCPLCGEPNSPLQNIHGFDCHACGEFVTDYTPGAEAHRVRELALDEESLAQLRARPEAS